MSTFLPNQTINLNSTNSTTITDLGSIAIFQLRSRINIPSNINAYIQLSTFKFSNVFYNVSEFNNVFAYSLSTDISDIQTVTVPAGSYSVSTLITLLNELLIDTFLILTLNQTNFRINVTNDTHGFILRSSANSIHDTLGFIVDSPQLVEYTAENAVKLSGVQVIQLSLPSLGINSNGVVGSDSSVLESIPVNVLTGSTQSYSPQHSSVYRIASNSITSFTVTLKSETGQLLDFHGSPWFLSVFISFQYLLPVLRPPSLFDLVEAEPDQFEDGQEPDEGEGEDADEIEKVDKPTKASKRDPPQK